MDRFEIAWRIWCWQEGYIKEEDREGLKNWLRNMDHLLTENDLQAKRALLEIADGAIEAAKESLRGQITGYKIGETTYKPEDVTVITQVLPVWIWHQPEET